MSHFIIVTSSGLSNLVPKWVRLVPNVTNPRLFQSQNTQKFDLKRSCICPMWADLIYFGSTPENPVPHNRGFLNIGKAIKISSQICEEHLKIVFWNNSKNIDI